MIARLAGSVWVRALLTIGVLAFLLSRIDARSTLGAVLRLDAASALIVLALLALDRIVMVWRWLLLLRASGSPVSARSAAWIYLVSSFVGGLLPAGVGADAARAWTLTQRTAQGSEAVASVAVDRLMGLLSLVLMAVLGVAIWAPRMEPALRGTLLLATVAALGAAVVLLWADRGVRVAIPDGWRSSRPGGKMVRLADALGRYRGRHGAIALVFLLSIGVQVLRILQAYSLGLGIGIDVPLSYYLFFMPIGLLALLMPVSISGFGIPQGVIVWLLRPAGVPDPQSLALSTLIVLTGIVANLPGAWLYLRARR